MKDLRTLLEASLLDIDASLNVTDEEVAKSAITQFINDNYRTKEFTISDEPNKDGKYVVSSIYKVVVINKNITSLTNGAFVWGAVKSGFSCFNCKSLESLEGAPEKVIGFFDCSKCASLKSLKGAPKKVRDNFICYSCKVKFEEFDVREVSDVKGKILV